MRPSSSLGRSNQHSSSLTLDSNVIHSYSTSSTNAGDSPHSPNMKTIMLLAAAAFLAPVFGAAVASKPQLNQYRNMNDWQVLPEKTVLLCPSDIGP